MAKFRVNRVIAWQYPFTGTMMAFLVIARPPKAAVAISDVTIEIAALGYASTLRSSRATATEGASLAMTMAGNFLSKTLSCTATKICHTPTCSAAENSLFFGGLFGWGETGKRNKD